MLVGSVATVISLLALAWVQELVGGFLSIFGVDPASEGSTVVIIVAATVLMYCLDFSVNTGQSFYSTFMVRSC